MILRGFKLSKGIVLTFVEALTSLLILILIIYALFVYKSNYYSVNFIVSSNEDERKTIILSQILLSSPYLCVEDDGRLLRGVFDVEKLKNIPNDLRDDVNYPHSTYEFTIKDIETNKDWSFNLGEDVEADHEYDVTIPVAIRYSNGNVNFGKMELKFYINET